RPCASSLRSSAELQEPELPSTAKRTDGDVSLKAPTPRGSYRALQPWAAISTTQQIIDASPQGIEAKPNETHEAMLDCTQLAQRLCCRPDGLARGTERNSKPLSRLRVIALAPDREVG